MTPNILIPCPTSFDPAYNDQCWPEYAAAVERAGGRAVFVPLDPTDVQWTDLLQAAHAVLLPGSGADVLPARYGHEAEPETAAADPLREAVDFRLLDFVHAERVPMLAICFGLQSLNVYRGGTLAQHLLPMPVNHRAGRAVPRAHAVLVAEGSTLGGIVHGAEAVVPEAGGGFLRLFVNSSHHQAIASPGDALGISARSTEDGVVEAVEDAEHPFLLGVQWHPERASEGDEVSTRLMSAFVVAASEYAGRTQVGVA